MAREGGSALGGSATEVMGTPRKKVTEKDVRI